MAVYRFKVSFEDYDEVIREIDLKSTQSFHDFHQIIHETTGYNTDCSSSFYVSNDHWNKGREIAYLPNERKVENGVTLMENAKLASFIDDPHQKFYYTYNFEKPYDFQIELIKILEEENGAKYPKIIKKIGEAPKINTSTPIATATTDALLSDDDFENLMFDPSDFDNNNDELDIITQTALSLNQEKGDYTEAVSEDEENNDFEDEFSNQNDDEYQSDNNDEDY
jgi:hypothetical protein